MPPSCSRNTVLYVEDNPVNVMLMAALLKHRPDFALVVAPTGEQALCMASDLRPALLLLDIRLPDCFGDELLPLLRLLPGCEVAPAVAVTAESDFTLEGSGFNELWLKPLDLRQVLHRLDALVAAPPRPVPLPQRLPMAAGNLPGAAVAAALAKSARSTRQLARAAS